MEPISDLIRRLADRYGRERSSLLPILQGVVEQEKYLSEYSMTEIARELNLPAADVYGTATFYSFLEYKKMGRYIIRLCKTITCSMKGENQILLTIQDLLKIKVGETTPDGNFSLLQTNCLGFCHKAPAMLINNEVYNELTPEKVRDILTSYINSNGGGIKNVNNSST
ncbi:MAG: NADH-quinone oxidoreductase subunit NuoE [Bacteroidales bacterium]|jgi:NADH:ubiquinone oxidoreductase subunit E|nr:NADH-quinone oxidoreductase subunit NuoE [Bacteroidales bacterium]